MRVPRWRDHRREGPGDNRWVVGPGLGRTDKFGTYGQESEWHCRAAVSFGCRMAAPSPPLALGRRNWTFAGSDAGGRRAAAMYTLIETCKLNDVDPRAWLADVLSRLPEHPSSRVDELLSWNWNAVVDQPRHAAVWTIIRATILAAAFGCIPRTRVPSSGPT